MSLGAINFSGISSGIDSSAIISEYLTIARQPETLINDNISLLQGKTSAYNTVSGLLTTLQAAAQNLDGLQSFDLVTANSSSNTVATVSAVTGAQTGSHTLNVNQLATAQEITSSAQTSQTAPLGFSGQFIINGQAITVQAADSLETVASDINSLQPGVTASILHPSANAYYLTIASKNSGLQGQISISDTGNNTFVSQTLGILTSSSALANSVSSTVAGSADLSDATTAAGTLLGVSSPPSGTVQITSGGVTKSVAINLATDSLTTIANNINTAFGSNVASVSNVINSQGQNAKQLQISGITGASSFVDNNSVLSDLGVIQTANLNNSLSATSVGSGLFTDSGTSVGTLLGETAPASGAVQITSGSTTKSVTIDLATDSLITIANNINAAFGSNVASVATVTNPITNATESQLQITGTNGASSFVDNNNVLANLGIVQQNYGAGNQLTAAQNATFTLDGLAASRATNSFSDAISGVTINLLQTGTTTLSVQPDISTIASNINNFVTAFNAVTDGINQQASFTAASASTTATSTTAVPTTGPLFGDQSTRNILNDLVSNVTGSVTGLPASLSALSAIGITLNQNDELQADSSTLNSELTNNLSGVAALFQNTGTPTNSNVQFVTGSSNTQPSGTSGYSVNITRAATQATVAAGTAQTGPLAQAETLTFGGALFPSGQTVTLAAGSTLNDVISQINGDSNLNQIISATDNNGVLTLTSKSYGSADQFTVKSNVAASATSSGIGTAVLSGTGQDVEGTINGESATGNGQFLTGNQTGGQADGLQLRVSANAPGSYGTVKYTSGIAGYADNYVTQAVNPTDGTITNAVNNINTEITADQAEITQIESEVTAEQTFLNNEFTAMETSVAQLKSAGAGLASLGDTAPSVLQASTSTSGL